MEISSSAVSSKSDGTTIDSDDRCDGLSRSKAVIMREPSILSSHSSPLRSPSDSSFMKSIRHSGIKKMDLEEAIATLKLNIPIGDITDAMLKKSKHKLRNLVDEHVLDHAQQVILEAKIASQDPMEQATQITDKIFLGPHTVARDRNKLSEIGITAIVSMAAECGIQFPDDDVLEYCFLADKLIEHKCKIDDVLEIIDDVYLFSEKKINEPASRLYIHCVQGKTRSAAATAFILAKQDNITIDAAYRFIKSKRDIFIPAQWLEALQAKLDLSKSKSNKS